MGEASEERRTRSVPATHALMRISAILVLRRRSKADGVPNFTGRMPDLGTASSTDPTKPASENARPRFRAREERVLAPHDGLSQHHLRELLCMGRSPRSTFIRVAFPPHVEAVLEGNDDIWKFW